METLTKTMTSASTRVHPISVYHGASGNSIPVDLSKLSDYRGTVEGALREAISKHVHPGFHETLDAARVDIELFSSGGEGGQAVERPISPHAQWSTILEEALKADVELGVARHARGGSDATA